MDFTEPLPGYNTCLSRNNTSCAIGLQHTCNNNDIELRVCHLCTTHKTTTGMWGGMGSNETG